MNQSRRNFLHTLTATAAGASVPRLWAAEGGPAATLRNLAGGRFLIGAAVRTDFETDLGPENVMLLAKHFDSVTTANSMKWPHICSREGEYHFDPVDRLVKFAEIHKQKVVGHTLIFNRPGRFPKWVFRDKGGKEAGADLVWKRVEDHIGKVMSRYAGRIDTWDVLNEFVEGNELGYRETELTRVLGKDYPVRLFKFAASVDPKAKLVYNDYSLEDPKRRKLVLDFVRSLQDRGCRIDIVGSQSHIETSDKLGDQIDATIRECAALGVRAAFTELDVDVISRTIKPDPKTGKEGPKPDPYVNGAPPEVLERQAEVYRQFFQAVVANHRHVDRVTFWGVTDADSWLNQWPWKRTNHALLFDRAGKPKPAFHAVAKVLTSGDNTLQSLK